MLSFTQRDVVKPLRAVRDEHRTRTLRHGECVRRADRVHADCCPAQGAPFLSGQARLTSARSRPPAAGSWRTSCPEPMSRLLADSVSQPPKFYRLSEPPDP